MAWGDRFYAQAGKKVEGRVGEPVELITRASRPGAMGALIAGQVARGVDAAGPDPIGLGGAAPRGHMIAPGGAKGARLPMSFLIALTPSAVRVFTVRQGWTGVKVKRELGVLPRSGIRLSIADGGVVERFRLDAADGSGIAFEMNRGKFTSSFAAQLRAALSTAG
jgi:hypothetical protein